jgi:uncharacterized protein (DUF3084 family)
MCVRKLFLFLLLQLYAVPAPQAEQWYLISETEVQNIEEYRKNTEAEKQDWLSQASELKTQAARLNERAVNLRAESENSNQLLRQERETNQKLRISFNEYEAATFQTISQRDTRISALEAENEKLAGQRNTLLAVVVTAVSVIVLFVAFKVFRFFKALPF